LIFTGVFTWKRKGWTIHFLFRFLSMTSRGLPFFINWARRPQLEFVRPVVESDPDKMDVHATKHSILLEVENHGKRSARNCYARFSVLSETNMKLPTWGVLDWIYEDRHRESHGNLSYGEKARIELLVLTERLVAPTCSIHCDVSGP
jgi:hypothetical protein